MNDLWPKMGYLEPQNKDCSSNVLFKIKEYIEVVNDKNVDIIEIFVNIDPADATIKTDSEVETIIYAHGLNGHPQPLVRLAQMSGSKKRHFIGFYEPGHGDTYVPGKTDTFEQWMDILNVIIKKKRINDAGPTFGIGSSLGGLVILWDEAKYPGTFDGLCLDNPLTFSLVENELSDLVRFGQLGLHALVAMYADISDNERLSLLFLLKRALGIKGVGQNARMDLDYPLPKGFEAGYKGMKINNLFALRNFFRSIPKDIPQYLLTIRGGEKTLDAPVIMIGGVQDYLVRSIHRLYKNDPGFNFYLNDQHREEHWMDFCMKQEKNPEVFTNLRKLFDSKFLPIATAATHSGGMCNPMEAKRHNTKFAWYPSVLTALEIFRKVYNES